MVLDYRCQVSGFWYLENASTLIPQAGHKFNVAAKFIWLALYSDLIINNLNLPNKFGCYEKRIYGQPNLTPDT